MLCTNDILDGEKMDAKWVYSVKGGEGMMCFQSANVV